MSELNESHFGDYFQSVHGYEPYPWQRRLTCQVLKDRRWPDVIDLPTGTGKTAVLDTAIFALAAYPNVFPRRVVFVIDRRIVVDQVYQRANEIRKAIAAASGGVLAVIRERLQSVTEAEPLGVVSLRGGVPIDNEWARRPDQPWVMVSTVDQFGSRLLFRGYGISPRSRPVHAGLAGNDCLVILDEVHLSVPFAQTLRDVTSDGTIPLMRSVDGGLLPRRQQFLEMSATPTNQDGVEFRLEDSDMHESELLRQIVQASKSATLVEVKGTRPAHETVPKRVLGILKKNLSSHELSVGVIVNRVKTARETQRLLRKEGYKVHLVTGRMRPIDREDVLNEISRCVDPARKSPINERTVVVATQAIEVGADFSFDALITEASPADSLRQRLGRLDRRGALSRVGGYPARCWVLGVMSAMNPKKPDPVYGDATRITWDWLQEQSIGAEVDVGLSSSTFDSIPKGSRAPQSEAPLLLPSHIDSWVQTNPEPVVQPLISEFLHGKQRNHEPDVSLVWRWDRSEEALLMVPPRPAEYLSIPISAARRWLSRGREVPVADIDTPSLDRIDMRGRGTNQGQGTRPPFNTVRWIGRKDRRVEDLKSVEQLAPGDVIVVDPRLGGITDGNWDPVVLSTASRSKNVGDAEDFAAQQSEHGYEVAEDLRVPDLGDEAQWAYGARRTLRLDQRLFSSRSDLPRVPLPSDEADSDLSREEMIIQWLETVGTLVAQGQDGELSEDAMSETDDMTLHLVTEGQDGELPESWVADAAHHFSESMKSRSCEIRLVDSEENRGESYYLLSDRTLDTAVFDGSDDSSLTGAAVMLRDHLVGVGEKASEFAQRLGLDDSLVNDLRLAGELHDLGKIDSRFQAQMTGNDRVKAALLDGPLAKSLPGVRTRRSGWPPLRHEIGSAALVSATPQILEDANDPDLVLYLIGTHHGYSRPLPPIQRDNAPQTLQTSHDGIDLSASSDQTDTDLALQMAERFWRLHERYGHHGIAWLEAIFRLADWQRSAEEAKGSSNDSDSTRGGVK